MIKNNRVLINHKIKNKNNADLSDIDNYLCSKFGAQDSFILDFKKYLKALFNSDRIVFHELPTVIQRLLFGLVLHVLNRKVDWVVWGGDLYDENYFALTENDSSKPFKLLILRLVNQFFVSRVNNIYSVRDDFYAIKLMYKGMDFKFKELYYPVPLPNVSIGRLKDKTRILICHSASSRNNHGKALSLLKSIDDGVMEVVAILSYGEESPEVIDGIIKKGHQLFGSRFSPIVDFMDQRSYWDLLSTISICISLSKRQSSIFTTATLLSLGVKVLMYSDISPYRFYTNNGLRVYDIVEELDRSEVLLVDEDVMTKNAVVAKKLWSQDTVMLKFYHEFNGLEIMV
jgi:hypothetical protein